MSVPISPPDRLSLSWIILTDCVVQFLTQCSLHFELNTPACTSERPNITYVILFCLFKLKLGPLLTGLKPPRLSISSKPSSRSSSRLPLDVRQPGPCLVRSKAAADYVGLLKTFPQSWRTISFIQSSFLLVPPVPQ